MIDLHAHILPSLDHGPADLREALAMARLAASDGIRAMAATPHVNHEFRASAGEIRAAVAELARRVGEESVPLSLLPGADYHLTPELAQSTGDIITLGDNGRYFLLELPSMSVPPNLVAVLKIFTGRGLTPVLTHPERNAPLMKRRGLLEDVAALGCPLQITGGSLEGLFGEKVREWALLLLEWGLADLLASDAHWEKERPPVLSGAVAAAAAAVGETRARALVSDNPAAILDARDIR